MRQLGLEFISYLRGVLIEAWRVVFTAADILGLVLFFYPNIFQSLGWDPEKVRVAGGILFGLSFLLANFIVYRGLIQQLSVRADIRITLRDSNHYFYPHFDGAGRSPFSSGREQIARLRRKGLPGWATLRIPMRIANHGWGEAGQCRLELVEAKTKLPSLFNIAKTERQFFVSRIEPREEKHTDCLFFFPFTEEDPEAFVRALKALTQDGQKYKVILGYWTERLGGEVSATHTLPVVGDFRLFYEEILKHWNAHNKELQVLVEKDDFL